MRQLLCIFFLSMLIAMQYNKQWNYDECKGNGNLRGLSFTCNCEVEDNRAIPLSKTWIHFHVDDFYMPTDIPSIKNHSISISTAWQRITSRECKGDRNGLFRPPCC